MARPHDPGQAHPLLPEWQTTAWLNTPAPITRASLRGRVVLLHTFQMLCPGCVSHGLPQAQRVHQAFPVAELAVVGLHTVFEHHAVMGEDALRAFVHEYRWTFPIGIDAPGGRSGPSRTMADYSLQGTPSCLLLDRQGRVRLHHFGRLDDLSLGAAIGELIAEADAAEPAGDRAATAPAPAAAGPAAACDADGCRLDAAGGHR